MSVLTDLIYGGSHAVAGLTEGAVNDAIAKYGADHPIAFPDTAYFFPTIYAATGVKVKTLGDLPACVGVLKSLITDQEDLGQALNAGLATAVGAEILEGLKFAEPKDAYEQAAVPGIGFVPDPIIRSLGVPLVTGDIPGVAVVLGKAENGEDVAKVVKDYQSKGIMTFMVGEVIEQCADAGVKMGLEFRVIPLGHDVTAVIHVVTVAIRAALIFGNVQPGDLAGLLKYTKERVPAFVNTFGAIDNVVVSAGAGAIALGFPVVVDIDLGENQVPGALESCNDHNETVKKSLELRGIKIKSKELPIPVAFAAAFEGEIIRKADMKVEFWSAKNTTCELVLMKNMDEVEDHKLVIDGPDIDSGDLEYALATCVYVAGKKMQADFEAANPDIKLEFVTIPSDYANTMITKLAGGEIPDVMMLAMDQVPRYALNGMLLPLDDLASQEYKDALYPVVKDALTVNGTMYAAARDVTPKVMYLNTKMFEDAGIEIPADTWTMDEFVEIAKQLTKGSGADAQWGYYWANWTDQTFAMIAAFGGELYSEDGKASVLSTDENTQKAVQFMYDLYNTYKVCPSATQAAQFGVAAAPYEVDPRDAAGDEALPPADNSAENTESENPAETGVADGAAVPELFSQSGEGVLSLDAGSISSIDISAEGLSRTITDEDDILLIASMLSPAGDAQPQALGDVYCSVGLNYDEGSSTLNVYMAEGLLLCETGDGFTYYAAGSPEEFIAALD